ncbi:MAG: adenylyl-sulfate kinase [Deltaproteobacteria bacterium]|nr:adenylyl-sulfate kinase [Deltaproteobacteria bacterium]
MNFCLWITGLPGSGKSTIAGELERMFVEAGLHFVTLSLDQIRKVLTPEPKYTDQERELVYRSLVLMAHLMMEHSSKNVIIDATGNLRTFRNLARQLIPEFAEIYAKCPLERCKARETSRRGQPVQKDLYQRASEGRLKGKLPGISAPYEEPEAPEVLVASDTMSPHESARRIMAYIRSRWTG